MSMSQFNDSEITFNGHNTGHTTTYNMHKSKKIVRDATHPANHLFERLKSGKRYRSVKAKTTRFRNSFYLEAIRYMNGEGGLYST